MSPYWDENTVGCKDFVRRMLCVNKVSVIYHVSVGNVVSGKCVCNSQCSSVNWDLVVC